jgi:hypothetical protein
MKLKLNEMEANPLRGIRIKTPVTECADTWKRGKKAQKLPYAPL